MPLQFRQAQEAAADLYETYIRPILVRLREAVIETVQTILLGELRSLLVVLQGLVAPALEQVEA